MNRFKKEIRKKGFKIASDYPWLPYQLKGKDCFEPGNILIDNVVVDASRATVVQFLNVAVTSFTLTRSGEIEEDFN